MSIAETLAATALLGIETAPFIYFVENFGRGFELGLAGVHMLSHHPLGLAKMMPMGMGMMKRGRMSIVPKQIKGIDSLKAILSKAKELEV